MTMVSPQSALIAVAVGAFCAIVYTVYTSLSQRPARQTPHAANQPRRRSRDARNERSRLRTACEICKHPVLNSFNLSCGHEYHKPCLMNLDTDSNSVPHVCISCWTPFTPEERMKISTMDNEVCTICLFAVEKEDSFILDCGHEFHHDCAVQMLNHEERRCPNCRDHLSTSDLRRLASGIS